MRRDRIVDVRAHLVDAKGAGGDYHDREKGHWLIDTLISNPMSGYAEYKASRTSWGIAVLGSILVEIETESGVVGVATGLGGPPACFMIEKHLHDSGNICRRSDDCHMYPRFLHIRHLTIFRKF